VARAGVGERGEREHRPATGRRTGIMMWTVRGTTPEGQDYTVVLEAESKTEAEYRVMKRGLPVVIVEEATAMDIKIAKAEKKLWKYKPDPVLFAFGRKVNKFQLACLMVTGLMTIVVILHHNKIPLRIW
jgi:hypothetical protein